MNVIECRSKNRSCEDCDLDVEHIENVIRILRDGGLVVYPTDTLYALGADPCNEKALRLLYAVKDRPSGMPLPIAVSSLEKAMEIAQINEELQAVMKKFLPGPLTVLARIRDDAPLNPLVAMNGKVGIRIPDHPLVLRLTERFGPITTTSANRHGSPEPTDMSIALNDLGEGVNVYIDCGKCRSNLPSTIIDISDTGIEVIREGAIPREALYG